MKFIPAFFSLGFFTVLAYWVWTDTIPFELLPVNEGNVRTMEKIQTTIQDFIATYGWLEVGGGLFAIGLVSSLYFVMQKPEEA